MWIPREMLVWRKLKLKQTNLIMIHSYKMENIKATLTFCLLSNVSESRITQQWAKPKPTVDRSSLGLLSVFGRQSPQVQRVSLASSKARPSVLGLFFSPSVFRSCGFLSSPQTWVIKAAGRCARLLVCPMSAVQWKHQGHGVQLCNVRLHLDSTSRRRTIKAHM